MISFFICIAIIFTVCVMLGYFLPAYGPKFTWTQFWQNPFKGGESWHPLLPILLGWVICIMGIIICVCVPASSGQPEQQMITHIQQSDLKDDGE